VASLNLDEHIQGWDITPAFTYQSGNPYGDPQGFPDIHCPVAGQPATVAAGNYPGCIPTAAGSAAPLAVGPDPYTGRFDQLGSLTGPSWISMNLGISHDLGRNVKGSFLWTNVFTVVHNHGYPWEYPTNDKVLAYGDNSFFTFPLSASFDSGLPTNPAYFGDNYYAYVPSSLIPAREFVFSLSTKL
jgi:hypothetical protein